MLWPLGEVVADDQEADSSSTFCNELLMQHCDSKDLGCKTGKECDGILQRWCPYDKESQPGIQIQPKGTDQDIDRFQSKQEVTRQGLPCYKAKDMNTPEWSSTDIE